jgi:hypothetical protein
MKPNRKYIYEHETRICGIPCILAVSYFHCQPPWRGSAHTCDGDMDYYGYTELEYDVLDRRGHLAEWLAKKIDDDLEVELRNELQQILQGDPGDDF